MIFKNIDKKILFIMLIASIVSVEGSSVMAEPSNTTVEVSPYSNDTIQKRINEIIEDNNFYNPTSKEPVENNVSSEDDWIVEKVNEIREATGLNVIGFEKHTFELSFYSDLNCENGYGNLTASGKTLSDGMIANNYLDFGTNVYIDGYGLKVVEDRGSYKYFNAVNKADVFVPRIQGESDSEYYKRVNMLGRKNVDGYILYIGDE